MHLDVAAYGWEGEAWSSSYPDDLPAEWRLEYYANQYTSVVVPHRQWQQQEDNELTLWLEETPESFRLYWEVATPEDARRLQRLYASCPDGGQPGGWLLLSGAGFEPSLLDDLTELAPVSHCREAGLCHSKQLEVLAVAPGEALRPLRQRIDSLVEEGCGALLLLVMPSQTADVDLQQLQTLSLLYAG